MRRSGKSPVTPYLCPDGSFASGPSACAHPGLVTCPDGSLAHAASDCEGPAGLPYLCPDGSHAKSAYGCWHPKNTASGAPERCSSDSQAHRNIALALFGAAFCVLLSRTIAPTHPLLGALGGAVAGLAYAGADTVTSCPSPLAKP